MTNLVRYSPNQELRQMQREIDRLFNGLFSTHNGNGDTQTALWTPRVDLAESEDAYLFYLDVPGMAKEELNISYQDGTLTVSGERRPKEWDETLNVVRMERATGPFYRFFSLPKAVVDKKIEAHYEDGVLTIHVPKAEESKPRRIKIT